MVDIAEIEKLADELREAGQVWFRDDLLLKLNRLIEIAVDGAKQTEAFRADMRRRMDQVQAMARSSAEQRAAYHAMHPERSA